MERVRTVWFEGAPFISAVLQNISLKHFPARTLAPLDLEAIHPDDFILDLLDLAPGVILKVIDDQVRALRNPPMEWAEVLDKLEASGLVKSVAEIRRLMAMDGVG